MGPVLRRRERRLSAVLIVVPTYCEAENIEAFLAVVREAAPDAHVLVVDDESPDDTATLAARAATRLGQIDVLSRPGERGLGRAYRAGFEVGMTRGYTRLVQIDADLSHDPHVIPALLAAIDDGADVAIGSRYVRGGSIPEWAWWRRAVSRWGNRYAGLVLRMAVRDATSGFRALRADTLRAISVEDTRAKGYGFQIESAYRCSQQGARIVEVPIQFTDRVRGQSKLSWGIVAEELVLVTWWGLRDRYRDVRGVRRSRPMS